MEHKSTSNHISLSDDKLKLVKGGYVQDRIDTRDYVYKIDRLIVKQLPAVATLKDRMPPVLDQGELGSCVSHAVCNALAFLNIKSDKPIGFKSRIFNYYNSRVLEGTVNEDSGCEIRDAIKTSTNTGNCYETTWPYIISQFTLEPPPVTYSEALQHKLLLYQRVIQNRSMIKGCIVAGYPIVIGIMCFNSLGNPGVDITGDIPMPTRKDYPIGGHCVLLTGYNDFTQRYEIQNSWGVEWGNKGYGTLPYAYVENSKLAMDFWQMQKE